MTTPTGSSTSQPLLSVRDLKVHFHSTSGWSGKLTRVVRAVDGISFDVRAGETLGLGGESGCGKSTTARGILNLIPSTAGTVELNGQTISGLSDKEMLPFRQDLQMIFQDPFASLNPRMTVGTIVREPMDIFN